MQFAVAALALASGISLAAAQGSQGSCSPDFPTAFTFQTMNATGNSKRSIDEELIEKVSHAVPNDTCFQSVI